MLSDLIRDTFAYIQPAATISDLGPDEAARRIDGAPHTVADLVAHLAFWQDWFLARCHGKDVPMAAVAADGWPATSAEEWPSIRDGFIRGLDEAVALSNDASRLDQPVTPAIDFPPLAATTVRDALMHTAVHNAHHLGQVVTLRQLMGRWPPPSGSWTW